MQDHGRAQDGDVTAKALIGVIVALVAILGAVVGLGGDAMIGKAQGVIRPDAWTASDDREARAEDRRYMEAYVSRQIAELQASMAHLEQRLERAVRDTIREEFKDKQR